MRKTEELGIFGEKVAEEYLRKRGYQILERNFSLPRWGEIDIIAVEKDTLVFIEVRTRSSGHFLSPQESITFHKIRTLSRAALYYQATHRNVPQALRLDLVTVKKTNSRKTKVEHFKNISF